MPVPAECSKHNDKQKQPEVTKGFLHMRDIKIEMVTNGYIVRVGCKSFVYHETEIDELLTDIKWYAEDPVTFEKKFLASCANDAKLQKLLNPVPAALPDSAPDLSTAQPPHIR